MPITERQLAKRRSHIGSSDTPAIIGCDDYRTAYDVWLEKMGMLWPEPQRNNEAAEIGNMIEGALLDWASAETGLAIVKNQRRVRGCMAANHDALAKAAPVGYEAKTTGILTPHQQREEWGDAGTDQVPYRVMAQCYHQMIVSELRTVYVPALIGGRGRVLYQIDFDPTIAGKLEAAVEEFWYTYVRPGVPPSHTLPSLEVAKRIKREPETEREIPAELYEDYMNKKRVVISCASDLETSRQRLIAALGTAEAGIVDGQRLVTYLPRRHTSLDAKALAATLGDSLTTFQRVTYSPTLIVKEIKAK
jgi:predicted phage-related endonuclease